MRRPSDSVKGLPGGARISVKPNGLRFELSNAGRLLDSAFASDTLKSSPERASTA